MIVLLAATQANHLLTSCCASSQCAERLLYLLQAHSCYWAVVHVQAQERIEVNAIRHSNLPSLLPL
jgi:hypothetical protein